MGLDRYIYKPYLLDPSNSLKIASNRLLDDLCAFDLFYLIKYASKNIIIFTFPGH